MATKDFDALSLKNHYLVVCDMMTNDIKGLLISTIE
jgi:hypothetical protein